MRVEEQSTATGSCPDTPTALRGTRRPPTPCTSLATVYGGGGMFGIGYGLGVASALSAAGVPVRDAPALGTSAGAWVASCLACGVGIDALCELPTVQVPSLRPGTLRRLAAALFGDARDNRVRAVAVQLPTVTRRILSGAELPLADLAAASASVPGLFAPSAVAGRLYVDGGVRSFTSADCAATARHLLVVAPVAGPVLGVGGRVAQCLLGREMKAWERTTGGTAHLIRPSESIARLVRHPFDLFDPARARTAYEMAAEQTAQLLSDRADLSVLARSPSVAGVPATHDANALAA